jgi:uncharacterized protein YaeQ
MALPSKVYKASIQLSDVDRGVYETLQATAAQHPSETEERLVARLLAYAIFHEPELTFTKGISATDEPDLWVKRGDDRVRLWVEVGLPEPDRIIKASRHSERVALLACGRTLANWDQTAVAQTGESRQPHRHQPRSGAHHQPGNPAGALHHLVGHHHRRHTLSGNRRRNAGEPPSR